MNPLQAAEFLRLDHQDRLQEAENWRLARQLESHPSWLAKLHNKWQRLSQRRRAQRSLELVQ